MKAEFWVTGHDRAELEARAYTEARTALQTEPTKVEVVRMVPLAYVWGQDEPVMWEGLVSAE